MTEELLNYFDGDELAATVWESKYKAEGEVTPKDTHIRLASEFAKIEAKYHRHLSNEEVLRLSKQGESLYKNPMNFDIILNLLKGFNYIIPGGSIIQLQ